MKRLILIALFAFTAVPTIEAGPLHFITHLSLHSIGKGIGKGVAAVGRAIY